MHCIMFRLSIFPVQLLVVAYNIFREINLAHKELINQKQISFTYFNRSENQNASNIPTIFYHQNITYTQRQNEMCNWFSQTVKFYPYRMQYHETTFSFKSILTLNGIFSHHSENMLNLNSWVKSNSELYYLKSFLEAIY